MEEQLRNDDELPPRTLFVTILCLLAYLGCATVFIYGISNMGEEVKDQAVKQNALITTIGAIFSIIGTALMWNMRQFGFWLFFAGTVFAIAGPMFIFGMEHVMNPATGYPSYINLILMLLFAINYRKMD